MEGALVASRAVHDGACAFVAGALLFPLYALHPADRRAWAADDPLRRALIAATGLALLSGVVEFAAVAAGMADTPAAAFDPAVLRATLGMDFGRVWLVRLGLLAMLAPLLATGRGRGGVTPALATAALVGLSGVGHAREEAGVAGALHVAADALHLLTAAVWTGGLPALLVVLARPGLRQAGPGDALRRFSAAALPAVAVLVLTGATATWLLAGSPLALGATAWGRLLLVKLALVAAMLGLAGLNRWRLTERLAQDGDTAAVRRSIASELGLAVLVFAVVGWLGVLSPMPMG